MITPVDLPVVDGRPVDRNGLAVLSRAESLALLQQKRVGRISVTMRALPTILPVTYTIASAQSTFPGGGSAGPRTSDDLRGGSTSRRGAVARQRPSV